MTPQTTESAELPDALRLADLLLLSGALPGSVSECAGRELYRLHAENESLRAGYDAARLEIASLHTQMDAVGAGGMEPLRKRCLHQISEPQAQPVGAAVPVATIEHTLGGSIQYAPLKAAYKLPMGVEYQLYTSPQPAAQALECGNCFEGELDRGHDCRKCGGTGAIQPAAQALEPAAAWRKVERVFHEYDGSAMEDTVGRLDTRYSDTKPLQATGWEPMYLHPAAQAAPVDAAVQRRDAERLDFLIEQRAYVVSDPSCCDGYWLHYVRPDGHTWVQCTEHATPREAIDAARAAHEGA